MAKKQLKAVKPHSKILRCKWVCLAKQDLELLNPFLILKWNGKRTRIF